MKTLVLSAALLAAFSGAISAHAASADRPTASTSTTEKPTARLVCPVTGTKIASLKAAVGHSVFKGKTYYFCCPECKPKFDKNPAKYVANAAKGKYEAM